MGWKAKAAKAVNFFLRPMGAELTSYDLDMGTKAWDQTFLECIKRAKKENRDPNDVLEELWPLNRRSQLDYIFRHFKDGYVVCEVGPGTGRYSRYLVNRAKKLYLVDYSKFACDFLADYFKGRNVEIIQTRCKMPTIPSSSVDLFFSFSVFVHIDIEAFYCYLKEAYRILRKNRFAVIHYANMMSEGGFKFFKSSIPEDFSRSIFRFHHPETVVKLAKDVGFEVFRETPSKSTRHFFIELHKP